MPSAAHPHRESTKETLEFRKQKWDRHCIWYDDPPPPPPLICSYVWIQKKRAVLAHVLHKIPVQIAITSIILLDLVLSVMEMSGEDVKTAGIVVILLLAIEVLLRIFVGGKEFFFSILNVIEALIILTGVILIFVGPNVPVGAARIVKPITRGMRGCRVALKVWLRGGHLKKSASQAIAAKAKDILNHVVRDLVRVRPENMHVDPVGGYLHVRKARLFAEALRDTHSPIVLNGGFVDVVDCSFPVSKIKKVSLFRKSKKEPAMDEGAILDVEIQNAMLVFGPGPEVDWGDEETIRTRKAKFIDFIYDTCVPKNLPHLDEIPEQEMMQPDGRNSLVQSKSVADEMVGFKIIIQRIRKKLKTGSRLAKRIFLDLLRRKLIQGVKIRITNIVVQYEDLRGSPNRRFLFGHKLGALSITTFMNTSGLQKIIVEDEMMASTASLPLEDLQAARQTRITAATEGSTWGDIWRTESMAMENVVITLERVSAFCSVPVTERECFTELLLAFRMQEALGRLISHDCREKIRLALAKHFSLDHMSNGHTPCSCRGEPLSWLLQQYSYVLLPVGISLDWYIPGLMGDAEDGSERQMKISNSAISFLLDNRQMESVNYLISYFRTWFHSDRQLHLRPEKRIEQVLPKSQPDGQEDWHTRNLRRMVVRQWWLHAFQLVVLTVNARTRNLSYIFSVQIRSTRRIEYIELMAHAFRVRSSRNGRIAKLMDRLGKLFHTEHEKEEESIHFRQRILQARMRMFDVGRSMVEARYVAAKREQELKTRTRIRRPSFKLKAGFSGGFDGDDEDLDEVNVGRKHSSQSSSSSGGRKFSFGKGSRLFGSSKSDVKQNMSARDVFAEIGINIGQLVPENIDLRFPVVEVCLYSVSLWNGERRKGGIRPPRFHPHGTRQKLFHSWFAHAGVTFILGDLEFGAQDLQPKIPFKAVELVVGKVGANYCDTRTGAEREAVRYEPIKIDEEARFLVAEFRHADERAKFVKCPTQVEGAAIQEIQGKRSLWNGVVHIGQLSVRVDTLALRRVELLVGDIGTLVHQKLMRWILAEPHWRARMPEKRSTETSWVPPTKEPRRAEESGLRHHLHIVSRFAELLIGIKLPFKSEIELLVNFAGLQKCTVQPQWTEHQWDHWSQIQAESFAGCPGRRPKEFAAHMVECEANLPKLRTKIHRTSRPDRMSFEILPPVADSMIESEDGNIVRTASDLFDSQASISNELDCRDSDLELTFPLGEITTTNNKLLPPPRKRSQLVRI